MLKNLPAMQETQVWSLGLKDLLEKEMANHSSILAWRILKHKYRFKYTTHIYTCMCICIYNALHILNMQIQVILDASVSVFLSAFREALLFTLLQCLFPRWS